MMQTTPLSTAPAPLKMSDPSAPPDPTAKRQPASLPLASSPLTPSVQAPAPAATPAQTAIAGATQNTTDPLAFSAPPVAQNGGGTPAGSLSPDTPPAQTPSAAPSFVPSGNLSYDSSTGIVQDSGTSLPLDQYLQDMVSSGRAHNTDEARLQALGSASTGIQYAGTGATQYAPGRGPTPSTPTPTSVPTPAPTDPASLATKQWEAPTGAAPDTNPSVLPSNIAQAVIAPTNGSDPNGPSVSGGPAAQGGGPAPISTTGPNAGVGLTPTDPSNPLTLQTITPNNTVDRTKVFQDSLNSTIQNVLDPAFQARERDLNRYNFGAGRGVSGMARTSQGDVASDYGRQIADLSSQGLANATTGSIEDLYRNIGIDQQQQGFQADQQKTAFQQAAQAQGLSDSETSQAFQQALQMFYAGQISDPAQFLEYLSGQYARPINATA